MDTRAAFEAWLRKYFMAAQDALTVSNLWDAWQMGEHMKMKRSAAYQAGRLAGFAEAREMAAKVCRNVLERGDAIDRDEVYAALHNEGDASACEFAIRALEPTP